MLKTESDLMKGIDDKFQKLLSQFEMNMNILEMKSKRQQFLIEKSKDETNSTSKSVEDETETRKAEIVDKETIGSVTDTSSHRVCSSAESNKDIHSQVSSKERRETASEKSESMVTVKEIDTKIRQKPKTYSMKLEINNDNVNQKKEEEIIENDESMGNVLKYISECAEMQNKKNKKRKKTISFSGQNDPKMPDTDGNESSHTMTGIKKKMKKKKDPALGNTDDMSGNSSKRKSNLSNQEVVRKCSKTVTNISKKGKKRNLRNSNNLSKDWISFNRNNAGKIQKASKSKTQLLKREDVKNLRKSVMDKGKNNSKKETVIPEQKQNKIEHFDTVENKLINEFFQTDIQPMADIKNKNKLNDLIRKTHDKIQLRKNNSERISFRSKTPLKVIPDGDKSNEVGNIQMQDLPNSINVDNKRNILANRSNKRINSDTKVIGVEKKLSNRRSLTNNKENNETLDKKMGNRFDDRKSVVSNIDLTKALNDKFKDQRDFRSEIDFPRAKSEIKVGSALQNRGEDNGELEDVKVELDEFFSEIPFVVGRSISRTFNLGLSFQHAMSMLRRVHSKKEVKDVLSIGRPESATYSESLHCMGSSPICEAMFSSEWTKEDEEAWEENPWDPELNRRRPKCTCLPNNCITLKNVLKQLTIKNPGFNMRSLQPSQSCTTNKLESEADLLRKPALKRAKSQTRTELLRNIRTIQIQLTPSTEILK